MPKHRKLYAMASVKYFYFCGKHLHFDINSIYFGDQGYHRGRGWRRLIAC